jgi:hypothetical protein
MPQRHERKGGRADDRGSGMSPRELIDTVYARLVELDCEPRLSPDGRTITATCPCCREPNGFEMTLPASEPERPQ